MTTRIMKLPTITLAWLCALCAVLLCAPVQAGTKSYYYTDAQGTVLAKADAQGNIVATYDYAPYGSQVLGAPPSGPTGYTGHVNDAESGLVYMQARYFDPMVGRFLSVDPKPSFGGNTFSFNRFMYTDGNPVGFIDANGQETNPVSGTSGITNEQLRKSRSNPDVGKFGRIRSVGNWNGGNHFGVDISAPAGSRLVAPISGAVTSTTAKTNLKGGNVIWITTTRGTDKVVVGMAHLGSFEPKNGDTVSEGQPVATSGETGNARNLPISEQHVHLSVRVNGSYVDPQTWFDQHPSHSEPPPAPPPPPPDKAN